MPTPVRNKVVAELINLLESLAKNPACPPTGKKDITDVIQYLKTEEGSSSIPTSMESRAKLRLIIENFLKRNNALIATDEQVKERFFELDQFARDAGLTGSGPKQTRK